MANVTPTGKSISQVKKDLLNPATTSHFLTTIGSPPSVVLRRFQTELGLSFNIDKQEQLNLLCSETALPGSRLSTAETRNHFPGVRERHVYRREFDDIINLVFYVDAEQYLPIRYFESWINFITNSTVTQIEGETNVEKENFSHVMQFPNEYKGSLEITKFEKNLEFGGVGRTKALTYKFVNVFPLAISSMPVSYNTSRLLKCSVGMAYTRHFISGKPLRPLDESTGTLTQGEIDIATAPTSLSLLEIAKRNSQISGLGRNELSVPLDFA
mgnify:CR=1 FL=1